MIDIIRIVIVSVEHAALIEALYQHALSVQIAESERTVYFVHALLYFTLLVENLS